ncbi:conserved hypothetical protein [Streptomyces sp. C]|nr:conserved hypothetical protein [Streptomyces sp. C]
MAQWEVILVGEVAEWFEALAETDWSSAEQVEDAVDALAMFGPTLGRPLVDRIKGAEQHHMKELRPGSSGSSEIRILFASTRSAGRCCSWPATRPATGSGGTKSTSRSRRSVTRTTSGSWTRGSTNERCRLGGGQAPGARAPGGRGPAAAVPHGEAGRHGPAHGRGAGPSAGRDPPGAGPDPEGRRRDDGRFRPQGVGHRERRDRPDGGGHPALLRGGARRSPEGGG